MVSKLSVLAFAAAAVAQPYAPQAYGASSTVTSAAATQSFACNPAHEYPEGRKCVSTNGGLTLLPPTSTASASTTYLCNPARETCATSSGVLVPASTTTYACNPAHQYPSGVSCGTVSGSLTLITATPSASAVSCVDQYNTCRQPKNGVSANQSFCAAQNAECKSKCQTQYDTCRTTRVDGLSANQAACAAAYAGCLGENPFDDDVVTQVVTAYTTYCPSATTFAHGNKTYTVTSATTLTISSCPGGCKVTTPVKSLPPATTVTAVVPHYTTVCPTPTTVTIQSSTYTVSTSTVITVSCPGGCTITTPVSMLPQPTTQAVTVPATTPATTPAGTPATTPGTPVQQTPSAPTSTRAVYTGAAEKVVGSGALMMGALGLFFL